MDEIIEYLKIQLEMEKRGIKWAQEDIESRSQNVVRIEKFIAELERTISDPPS